MAIESALGSKMRTLRRTHRLTQAELARRLGISPSYLNLIEHNRRPLSAELLVKLANVLPVDLGVLSSAQDSRLVADLLETFSDPLFEDAPIVAADVRELAATSPGVARAIVQLYDSYRSTRESLHGLAAQVVAQGGDVAPTQRAGSPTEEVSDLLEQHLNYFPELEEGAEALRKEIDADNESLFASLASYLERTKGVRVRVEHAGRMGSALRRYDPDRKVLYLSEVLRRGSRHFQLAHQVGLLTQQDALDKITTDPILTSQESRALCRVALASYFGAAVLMPYDAFLAAARNERYDIELLGHRFRTSFEQTCHRLTTLRRKGAEGIPFHMLRIDLAGNIAKRFSASSLRFARFSGACPRWNVFEAFQTPGRIRRQLSKFPDGQVFFDIARTVRKQSGGYKGSHTQLAILLGCEVSYAPEMVYADGLNLDSGEGVIPVGPSCRLCDRMDCDQRAYPPVQYPLTVNENVRGVSFYAPLKD